MNKSKVENGKVIEEFRKKFTHEINDKWQGERWFNHNFGPKAVEIFITNALNQQREEIVGEIKLIHSANPMLSGWDLLNQFLTKLEK